MIFPNTSIALSDMQDTHLINTGAKNVPFYTPAQEPAAGTPTEPQAEGSLFSSLQMRSLNLRNRIIVSPMCQYSAENGFMTAWHKQHLGSFAARGAGLIITESISVTAEGRITPQDLGIWNDAQKPALKEVVDFVHSQNSKIAIQMAHAGRKASTVAPWIDRKGIASTEAGGWPDDVVGPSALAFNDGTPMPREMTMDDIASFKSSWAAAVKRALDVGYDAIEIHAAHGYLLNSFLSPASNKRTDSYGGSFENRIRLLVEIVELTRLLVPENYPVFARIPGTDYLQFDTSIEQWHVDDAVKLANVLANNGVDFLDVSGGGNDDRQRIVAGPGYQIPWAAAIKKAVKGTSTFVSGVGNINSAKQAQNYIEDGSVDAVVVGRPFLQDPNLVVRWADELGVDIHVASQYGWAFGKIRRSSINA